MPKNKTDIRPRHLRSIAALAIPAIVSNITTPLLSLTDVAIVGHLGGEVLIAAIAVGGTMFNMLFWLFGFIRMGSGGLTAQAFGASDRIGAQAVMNRSLLLAASFGTAIIVLQNPLFHLLAGTLAIDGATLSDVRLYYRICVWGAPAVLGMFAVTGWCVGMQNSRLPMAVAIFMDVFNIGLSILLAFGAGMGLAGVATGTLCAQWAGFGVAMWLCARHYGWPRVPLRRLTGGFGRFFKINTDIFLRTLCLVAVTMWFTRSGAEQGPMILAVNALLMQLFTLFSYMMDGLAFAAEALCGRYLGARDHDALRGAVRAIFACGSLVALIFTIAYVAGGDWLISLLSNDHAIRQTASEFSVWAMCIPLIAFAAFLWDGVFIGVTRTRRLLLSMAVATAVYFILYFSLHPVLGNHGLWIAFLAYLLTRGVVLTIAGRHYLWYSSR